ncbi:MAG: peptidylprolyl isomerase [Opitutales bacterium]
MKSFCLFTATLIGVLAFAGIAAAQEGTPGAPNSDGNQHSQPAENGVVRGVAALTVKGAKFHELGLSEAQAGEVAVGVMAAVAAGSDLTMTRGERLAAMRDLRQTMEGAQEAGPGAPELSTSALNRLGRFFAAQTGLFRFELDESQSKALRSGIQDALISAETFEEVQQRLAPQMPAINRFVRAQQTGAADREAQARQQQQAEAEAFFAPIAQEWQSKAPQTVVLETTQGDITLELMPEVAPIAVANFVQLIEQGYYDGLTFHRVIPGFMIQGGDPEGTGRGGESVWGRAFPDEFDPAVRFDEPGLLAMANAGPMTNRSQFFITTAAPSHLNDRHTIFGKVTEGYDVVEQIAAVDRDRRDKPKEAQVIENAYIAETAEAP